MSENTEDYEIGRAKKPVSTPLNAFERLKTGRGGPGEAGRVQSLKSKVQCRSNADSDRTADELTRDAERHEG